MAKSQPLKISLPKKPAPKKGAAKAEPTHKPKKVAKKAAAKKPPVKPAKPPKPPKPVGRPSIFTQKVADKICEEIATSNKSLRTICAMEGMPAVSTVLKWLQDGANGFTEQYARAKEEQADLLVEDMLDISEHTDEDHTAFTGGNVVQRDRLRIETRKWIASKLKPKKYGEKLDVTNTNRTIIVEAPDEDE